MLDNLTIGDYFVSQIHIALNTILLSQFSILGVGIKTLISSILILSLVVYGIRLMFGDIASTGKQLATTCVWCLFGLGVVDASFYSQYIIIPLDAVMTNIAGLFISGELSNSSIFIVISQSFSAIFDYAGKLMDEGGISELGLTFAGLTVYITYGLYYCALVIVILMAQIGLSVFYLFGVIIIPLSAFQMFRGMFKSWIGAIAKYSSVVVVVSVITSLLNKITVEIVTNMLSAMKNAEGFGTVYDGALLLNGLFGFLLISKAIEITAELTGGVASDTSGAFKAGAGAASGAITAGKFSGKWGGIGSMKALKHHYKDMA